VPIVTSALLFALMTFSLIASVLVAIWKDTPLDVFAALAEAMGRVFGVSDALSEGTTELSFGPGVYFLFAARIRDMKPATHRV
jgi:hypothetical protein